MDDPLETGRDQPLPNSETRQVASRNIFHGDIRVSGNFAGAIAELANADRDDVQAIAGSQLKLLAGFYEVALDQARKSFRWAITGSLVGIAFFMAAIAFVLGSGSQDAGLVSAISGGIVEVIAGINFFLYGKTTTQLLGFHSRLEQTQRFLLANSICEGLPDGRSHVSAGSTHHDHRRPSNDLTRARR